MRNSSYLDHHLLRHWDPLSRGRGERKSGDGAIPNPIVDILVHQGPRLLGKGAGPTEDVESLILTRAALNVEASAECCTPPGEEKKEADNEGD